MDPTDHLRGLESGNGSGIPLKSAPGFLMSSPPWPARMVADDGLRVELRAGGHDTMRDIDDNVDLSNILARSRSKEWLGKAGGAAHCGFPSRH